MDCKKIEEIILTDYADGTLKGGALMDVEAHLAMCSRCRSLASEVVSLGQALRNVRHEEPPEHVWENIRARVEKEPARAVFARDFFESIRLLSLRLRPAIAIAAAVALVLVVLTVARLAPQQGMIKAPIGRSDILSLASLGEDENGADYDFGTQAEGYFL